MVVRAFRYVARKLDELADPRPSVPVAHVQEAFLRAEMDLHPLERHQEADFPVGHLQEMRDLGEKG
jgi:hypothetical protein